MSIQNHPSSRATINRPKPTSRRIAALYDHSRKIEKDYEQLERTNRPVTCPHCQYKQTATFLESEPEVYECHICKSYVIDSPNNTYQSVEITGHVGHRLGFFIVYAAQTQDARAMAMRIAHSKKFSRIHTQKR